MAGLSFASSEREVEDKFGKFGKVENVRIVRNPQTGDSRGFGFLKMATDDDVDEIIKHLHEQEWNGRILLVERARGDRS